jgi:hypothetical protein
VLPRARLRTAGAAILRALLSAAAGHGLAAAIGFGAVLAGLPADRRLVAAMAGALLVWIALAQLAGSSARLGLCSFMLSSAHGAGMMLVPMLGPVCLGDGLAAGALAPMLAALALHTAGMVAASAVLAGGICHGLAAAAAAWRARA